MNFFEAQDSARRSTTVLVLMFVLAVAGLLVLSNLIVFELLYYIQTGFLTASSAELATVFDTDLAVMISAAILGFITLGSLYKLAVLSSGGPAIAMSLGGVIVPRSSEDPLPQQTDTADCGTFHRLECTATPAPALVTSLVRLAPT